jgi:hypothetical protein
MVRHRLPPPRKQGWHAKLGCLVLNWLQNWLPTLQLCALRSARRWKFHQTGCKNAGKQNNGWNY